MLKVLEKRVKLRELIENKRLVRAPVPVDTLSAVLIEQTGFEAIAQGGYPTCGSQLGLPDIGLLTMTEIVEQCRRIANATNIPLIVDADTGYGNAPNVARTVLELENAGASAIVLEDQKWPKRCGHMQGKEVAPLEEYLTRIRAAVLSKQDPNTVIIARTDARAVIGLDEAILRANAALAAGADVAFVEAPRSVEELREITKRVNGPCFANMLDGGKTPLVTHKELQEMGISIVVHPTAILFEYVKKTNELLSNLAKNGITTKNSKEMCTFEEYTTIVGLNEKRELEQRCLNWSQKEAKMSMKAK